MKKALLISAFAFLSSASFGQIVTLFSVDKKTQEVVVSCSKDDSNGIIFIERIQRGDNPMLYAFVCKLTEIAQRKNVDIDLLERTDAECLKAYTEGIK